MTPFIFGAGTDAPTYKDLQRRRAVVDALQAQSVGKAPRNVGEGIAAIGNALAGYMANRAVGKKEDAERERVSGIYDALVGNGQGGFSGGVSTGSSAGGEGIKAGLVARGLPEHIAEGFVMNFGDESGFDPGINEKAPAVPGSRGGFGLAQWTGPRRTALEGYAREMGRPVSDRDTQLDFLMQELAGPERAAAQSIMGTSSPGEAATAIARDFLRPAPEHLANRVAKYGGMGGMSSAVEAMNPTQMSQLAELAANPYLDDGKRMVVQALLQQSVANMAPQQPMTPYQAAQLALSQDRLDFDREKFSAGTREGPKFYGTAQWADRTPDDDDPTLSPYQIGTDGSVNWLDLSGAQPQPPTRNVDLGTTQAQVGPGGGVQNTLEKDVAGAAAQTDIGKANAAAAAGLGEQEITVQAATEQIDRILNNPALPSILGNFQGRMPPLSQEGANLVAEIDGLTGKVFASAINALRGLGAMSEREGEAVKQSLANLSRIQDEKAYAAELTRLKGILQDKLAVARQKAAAARGGGNVPQSAIDAGIDPDLWQYMTPEDQAVWSN